MTQTYTNTLKLQVTSLISIFTLLRSLQKTCRRPRLCQSCKLLSVYLVTRPNMKLEDHPCRLSATTCAIYLQFPSKFGGCVLQPQTGDAPCRGTMAWQPYYSICKSKRVLECSPIITSVASVRKYSQTSVHERLGS